MKVKNTAILVSCRILFRTFEQRSKVLSLEKAQIIWLFAHLFVPLQPNWINALNNNEFYK